MSRQLRQKGIWPEDRIAVCVWHIVAVIEDIADLGEASKALDNPYAKVTVVKKMLVDLKSLDDNLLPILQDALRSPESAREPDTSKEQVRSALQTYHRAVQPHRELLANIRNILGAHRIGLPDDDARKKFGDDFKAWGSWEHRLVELEQQCTLEQWIDVVNAAIALRNAITENLRGSWFSFEGNRLRRFVPNRVKFDG